ncbi:MAG TPA: T9SS type A sorting domain-containing protein, partial [Saprospiraceae bacterium]|nr:T9SS type A sorting domain-containing protein [Saprospiraceae bacterium]
LPRWENVVLTISDLQGRVVFSKNSAFVQGYNEIMLATKDLPTGVLQYTLSTETSTLTRRMVVVK